MKTQHTPGPWTITCEGGAIVGNECGTLVVETGLAYWQNLASASAQAGTLACRHIPEVMANARLIAAAPELLAEMRRVYPLLARAELSPEIWSEISSGSGIATLNGFRAAIAKATVESA